MKTSEAVRQIMKDQDIGVSALAAKMDSPPRRISERLSQENISISKLREMLKILDYKIVLLPRTARLPEGGMEIE